MKISCACQFGKWFFIRRRLARLREEQGQSLVELAIALPVFLMVLMGALEFGRLAYAQLEITNAARAGVAYGMQGPATADNISAMETAAVNDGADISGLTATASEYCTCGNGASVSCASAAATCTSYPHVFTYIQVTTQASVNPMFYVTGLPKSFLLTGNATVAVQ
jgi:Flp pilus assembly protein TadG